jgi:hypothetical protein
MNDEKEMEKRRSVPQSDLDFNLMTTDPVWGGQGIDDTLRAKLKRATIRYDAEGNPVYDKEELWGLLNFYTRDMRLANLSKFDGEILYVKFYLDLAGDFLQSDMIQPFIISLSRAATVLELSQSKNGFLRRRMNTFTQEQFKTEMEPPKKKLFGGYNKERGA